MSTPPTALSPQELSFIQDVDDLLLEFTSGQKVLLLEVSPEALPLVDAIEALGAGGKRLRALFVHWGWRAAGGDPEALEPVRAGAALELFQTAALIHDDVIDHSETRRGQPSVHEKFARLHRGLGWRQDAQEFGVGAGIIAGDLCLSFSEALFATLRSEEAVTGRARAAFDLMRTEVMAGQYLDVLSEVSSEADPEAALHRASTVIRFKSAKYSCEHPLVIGAALAGADGQLLRGLREFGLPLGEAFQLRDDVLGVFGHAERTGKPSGDDLREGKRTVLTALAQKSATPEQARLLEEHLGQRDMSQQTLEELMRVIVDTGALAETERIIAATERQIHAALSRLDVPAEVTEGLEAMARRALHRTH